MKTMESSIVTARKGILFIFLLFAVSPVFLGQSILCPINPPPLACNVEPTISLTGQPMLIELCANPVITHMDMVSPGDCPNTYTIQRTFYVTDDCGNNLSCIQVIDVIDQAPPLFSEFVTPPNPAVFTLRDRTSSLTEINLAGTYNNIANVLPGEMVNLTFSRTTVREPDAECPGCIVQHHIGIPGIFSECLFSTTGNSSNTHNISFTAPNEPGVYYIQRTSTLWYSCDQFGIPEYPTGPEHAIAVLIVGEPGCPGEVSVSWMGEIPAPSVTGTAIATDPCDPTPTITFLDDLEWETDLCPEIGTIHRTWTVTDACGNVNVCIQPITLIDDQAPVISGPSNIEVPYGIPTDPETIGIPEVYDNFDNDPILTYTDQVQMRPYPLGKIIERTWTATDVCGNESFFMQLITELDAQPGIICPANTQPLPCNITLTPEVTGEPVLMDLCENPSLVITDVQLPEFAGIHRTFTVTDDCGNNLSCVQVIHFENTTPPIFADFTIPSNPNTFNIWDRTSSLTGINLAGTGNNIATVQPGETVTLSFARTTVREPDAECPGCIVQHHIGIPGIFSQCLFSTTGNSSNTHNISFIAPNQPGVYYIQRTGTLWYSCDQFGIPEYPTGPEHAIGVLIVGEPGCPGEISFPITGEIPGPNVTGMAVATDLCDPALSISFVDDLVWHTELCPQVATIHRTWNVTNAIGNGTSCIQPIILIDDLAPVISGPSNIEVPYGTPTDPETIGIPEVYDNFDNDPILTYTDQVQMRPYPLGKIIERTWTATDVCGNESFFIQLITELDAQPGIICPEDTQPMPCNITFSPEVTGEPLLQDLCDNPYINYEDSNLPAFAGIERTFTVTDDCGNNLSCIQVIHFENTTPPIFADFTIPSNPNTFKIWDRTSSLSGINLAGTENNIATVLPGESVNLSLARTTVREPDAECPGCIVQHHIGIPGIFSECLFSTTGNSSNTHNINFTAPNEPGVYYIQRTGTLWYSCDQFGIPEYPTGTEQAIAVLIVGEPGCPVEFTMTYMGEPPDPTLTGMPVVANICNFPLDITFTDDDQVFDAQCPHIGTIQRTWTVTDPFGNISTCIQPIHLYDDLDPVINCPPDLTLPAGISPIPENTGFPIVTDNYDLNPSVTYTDVTETLPLEQVITRSWTVTDVCGNTSTCTQLITSSQMSIEIAQIDMEEPFQIPNSTYGVVSVTYPPIDDVLFLNVDAISPITGDTIWIVQNMPLFPFPNVQTMDYWFDFSLLGYQNGDVIETLPVTRNAKGQGRTTGHIADLSFIPVNVESRPYIVPADNPGEITSSVPTSAEPFEFSSWVPQVEIVYRGCEVPNIDLDRSNNPATAEYAGDKNACGPASAANSMQWLELKHPQINSNTTLREKVSQLSKGMNRANEAGVTTTQLVNGKLDFIDKHKLPIRVKFQSWFLQDSAIASPNPAYGHKAENKVTDLSNPKPPTWEFLMSEMQDGEDVEILFGWYDINGNRHGGHWITVTGIIQVGEFKGITFKDDENQSDSTGTRQKFVQWGQQDEWGRLIGFQGPNSYCWVESIVSESYDSTVTFPQITIEPQVSIPFTGEIPGPEITGFPTVTETCEPEPEIVFSDELIFENNCPEVATVLRTWTATDACGNIATSMQTISLILEQAPVISCPVDITIPHEVVPDPDLTGTPLIETLSPEISFTTSYSDVTETLPLEQVITRTWTVTDLCGNTSTCTQLITSSQMSIEIAQIDMEEPFQILNSTYGVVSVTYPPIDDVLFLNVDAISPITGDTIWIVQNMPLFPFPNVQTMDYWFDFSLLGYQNGDVIETLPVTRNAKGQGRTTGHIADFSFIPVNVESRPYIVPADNPGETTSSVPTSAEPFEFSSWVPQVEIVYRGCEVPNIDLDRSNNPATAEYAGDKNACGPASAANSMQWLELKHPQINSNTTLREKVSQLSKGMNRANEAGVTTTQLVTGKLDFIDAHQLPVRVKFQSWFIQDSTIASPNPNFGHEAENKATDLSNPKPPTWEFLMSEMQDGEDVEILFGWYDINGNRHGGHWITVTGIIQVGEFKGITFKDDENQSDSTGTRQKFVQWGQQDEWGRLIGFQGPNSYCWVESIVSESYDSTVTFPQITIEPQVSIPFTGEIPGPEITGFPTVTETCEPEPEIVFSDELIFENNCPEVATVLRTWTATDACGNIATSMQTISLILEQAPVISCPVDITIPHEVVPDPDLTGTPLIETLSPEISFTTSYSDVTETLPLEQVITRTWTVTDLCGNTSTCTQLITSSQMSIEIAQIDMEEPFQIPNSTYGVVSVTYPPIDDVLFLNVDAISPITGDTIWIVQNMPLFPFPNVQTMDYWFDFSLLGYQNGDVIETLPVTRIARATGRTTAHIGDFSFIPVNVESRPYIVPADNPGETTSSVPTSAEPFEFSSWVPQVEIVYRGCEVPNIDLDRSNNPATAEYAGDKNACGPASAANSMQWLELKHPQINSNTTLREKVSQLSKGMNRANEAGVTTTQLVNGKLDFIDKHKLPIRVKFQSWFLQDSAIASPNPAYGHKAENKATDLSNPKPPTWEFLMSEMQDGEDVEILFGWYDINGNRHGGHWITVTGIIQVGEFKGITFKDDENQSDSTGTRQKFVQWGQQDEWGRLIGFQGPNSYCWVESIVSESYDSTVTFPQITIEPQVSIPFTGEIPGPEITGFPTVTETCEPEPEIVFSDELIFENNCPEVATVLRTWTATDACGNIATSMQTISLILEQAPFISCPVDITIPHEVVPDPDLTGTPLIETLSPEISFTTSYSDVTETLPLEQVITRTWTVTDVCGNTSTCTQLITSSQMSIEIAQIDMEEPFQIPNSTYGVVSVTYPPIDDVLFLNVDAISPITGDTIWIVQNMPLFPFPNVQTMDYWFDFSLLGYQNGDVIETLPVTRNAKGQGRTTGHIADLSFIPVNVESRPYHVPFDNPGEITSSVPTSAEPFEFSSWVPQVEIVYRGCEVPNIDLDRSNNPATAEYAGDKNACGPASAANSMQWLELKHPQINSNTTLREKVSQLSKGMNRANEAGVTTTQLVTGKLDFIDAHQLPVRVKFQSWFIQDSTIASPNPNFGHEAENKATDLSNPKPPTWEFLMSEMQDGEDVEILFGWYDINGNRHGGHWITVTGIIQVGEFKGITFKDDENQSDSTGTRQKFVQWGQQDEWGRLIGFQGPNSYCWVESIVSESYDSTVTFPQITIEPQVSIPFTGEIPGPEITGFPTVTETCEPEPEIVFSDELIFENNCPEVATVLRTWTATDACGNIATSMQTISLILEQAPVISCPVDITIPHEVVPDPDLTGTPLIETLSPEISFTTSYSDVTETLPLEQVITRTWTVTDLCGNTSTCTQLITSSQMSIEIAQIDMEEPFQIPNSTYGVVSVTYPPIDDVLFLNVDAISPITGDTIWIVQNMPLFPFPNVQTMDYWFDFSLLGYQNGDVIETLPVTRIARATGRTTAHIGDFSFIPVNVESRPYIVPADNPGETTSSVPTSAEPFEFSSWVPQVEIVYRGCEVPNIDLDRSNNPATAEYAGDKNACGPASAANSMQWLELKHPQINSNTTLREKVSQLSKGMNRANEAGVTTTQLVNGKLDFIDKHKLPIRVKFQSWFLQDSAIASPNPAYGHKAENKATDLSNPKPPTWEFLMSEMQDGEDVEILFGWYDINGNRHGGHWITVTGIIQVGEFKGITFKDDENQSDSTGTRQKFVQWGQQDEWGRLIGFQGPNSYCWVESIVSESYDSTVTFPQITIEPQVSIPFTGEIPGPEITGFPTVTETCEPEPEIVFSDELIFENNCPEVATVLRTWTATDACGNIATSMQTISLILEQAPFISCPVDITIPHEVVPDPDLTGTPLIETLSPEISFTTSYSDVTETLPLEQVITRTWTVTDVCGNTSHLHTADHLLPNEHRNRTDRHGGTLSDTQLHLRGGECHLPAHR
jgi:predicted RNA methylase